MHYIFLQSINPGVVTSSGWHVENIFKTSLHEIHIKGILKMQDLFAKAQDTKPRIYKISYRPVRAAQFPLYSGRNVFGKSSMIVNINGI
jgi:hypothetical protein